MHLKIQNIDFEASIRFNCFTGLKKAKVSIRLEKYIGLCHVPLIIEQRVTL